jgi:hypothetical protein
MLYRLSYRLTEGKIKELRDGIFLMVCIGLVARKKKWALVYHADH